MLCSGIKHQTSNCRVLGASPGHAGSLMLGVFCQNQSTRTSDTQAFLSTVTEWQFVVWGRTAMLASSSVAEGQAGSRRVPEWEVVEGKTQTTLAVDTTATTAGCSCDAGRRIRTNNCCGTCSSGSGQAYPHGILAASLA